MSDSVIENGILTKYIGPGGDVVIPAGVTTETLQGDLTAKAKLGVAARAASTDSPEALVQENWVFDESVKKLQPFIKKGIRYVGSKKTSSPEAVVFVIAAYVRQIAGRRAHILSSEFEKGYEPIGFVPPADRVAAALDREALLALLENLVYRREQWDCITALGRYADEARAEKLLSAMEQWKSWGRYGRNGRNNIMIARGALMLSDTRAAMRHMEEVGRLEVYASLRGVGVDALRAAEADAGIKIYDLSAPAAPEGQTGAGDGFVIENGVLKKYTGPGGDVVIPNGVTSIGPGAFKDRGSMTAVTIPEGVLSIGDHAFAWCFDLAGVTLPKSVMSIGDFAFRACPLTDVTIPAGVTSIGNFAFFGCTSLTNVTLPEGVTSIGDSAFEDCGNLKSAALPESVTSIGRRAFAGCSLQSIRIPAGVTSIGAGAFPCGREQTRVTVPDGKAPAVSVLDALDRDRLTELYFAGQAELGPLLLQALGSYVRQRKDRFGPECVRSGTPEAMKWLLGLWKKAPLELLDACLDAAAEAGRTEFTALLLDYKNRAYPPEKIEAMEQVKTDKAMGVRELSLADWRKIFKITVKDGTATITGYKGTETEVTIPERVGKYTVVALEGTFDLRAPGLTSEQWNVRHDLTSVTIPEGVTSIGSETFNKCRNLRKVTIPASVTRISGYRIFDGCPGLTLHAPAGSYAEQYAKENDIPFEAI